MFILVVALNIMFTHTIRKPMTPVLADFQPFYEHRITTYRKLFGMKK